MRRSFLFLGGTAGLLLVLLLTTRAVLSAPVERSVSSSRQFVIYGTTTPLRGAVGDVAEQTKATLLGVMQQRDNWKIPILLNLQFPQANLPELPPSSLRFSQTGAGLKIQLDLTIFSDFDAMALRRQLLRVLLLEMIYRDNQQLPAGSFYIEPPEWFVEGLLAANPLQDLAPIIAAVKDLPGNKIMPLEQFLRQKFELLDSAGQLLYRGYALAFLKLLLSEPNGSARLARFLVTLPQSSSDPTTDLKEQFPLLSQDAEADSLWRMAVSNLALREYQLLTTAETEGELKQLVGEANGVTGPVDVAALAKKRLSKSEVLQLHELKEKLIVLAMQANPILRSLVLEYQQLVDRILAHKTKGVSARLATLNAKRQRIGARTTDIDDYLNWFEAAKSGTVSGAFNGYIKAAAASDELAPRRRDPLSVYLDALEEQF